MNKDNITKESLCVSSATDCTGLMPRPPQNEDELDSYESLYSLETTVEVPKNKKTNQES